MLFVSTIASTLQRFLRAKGATGGRHGSLAQMKCCPNAMLFLRIQTMALWTIAIGEKGGRFLESRYP